MRLFFEVFSLVLLAAVITVTARAEQLPQSKRDNTPRLIPLPPPAERETRSFGSLPREGNEASNARYEKENNDEIKQNNHEIPVKLLYEDVKEEINKQSTENQSTVINNQPKNEENLLNDTNTLDNNITNNNANNERLSRSNEKRYQQQKTSNKDKANNNQETNTVITDKKSYPMHTSIPQPIWAPDNENINENIEFSGPLDKNLQFYLPQSSPEMIYHEKINGYRENDNHLIGNNNDEKTNYPYKNNFNNFGLFFRPDREEKYPITPQFYNNYYQDYNIPQFNFNPSLKDIFNYNPVFDYIKKTDNYNDGNNNYFTRNDDDKFNDGTKNSGNIRRRIQHYQTVYQPNPLYYLNQLKLQQLMSNKYESTTSNLNNQFNQPNNLISNQQNYQQILQNQQENKKNNLQLSNQPSVSPISNDDLRQNIAQKIFDDYFPVVVQNPFNSMWTAFTNIIEYGPEADVCKRKKNKNKRRGRDILKEDSLKEIGNEDDVEEMQVSGDDVTDDFLDISRTPNDYPNIRRLKVRRGGVAIAGPGGIATAGSGGTAIVGPGGTAYTKEDGTAIVGPGGRLVHVPEFFSFPFFKKTEGDAARSFKDPPGSKFIAMGPLIYYNLPSSETNE